MGLGSQCGDGSASAGSTGLPSVRNGALQRASCALFSGELVGRSVVRRRRLPTAGWLHPPLSGAAGSYHLASTQKQHRRHTPATRVTGLRTPPKRRKTLEESLETRCPRCRSRGLPALRVLVLLLLPVFAAVQPRRKFGEWRLRLPCGARSVSAGACQGIPCSNSS